MSCLAYREKTRTITLQSAAAARLLTPVVAIARKPVVIFVRCYFSLIDWLIDWLTDDMVWMLAVGVSTGVDVWSWRAISAVSGRSYDWSLEEIRQVEVCTWSPACCTLRHFTRTCCISDSVSWFERPGSIGLLLQIILRVNVHILS